MSDKKVKVRVILDQGEHTIDDVLTLSAEAAKVAVEAGWADDHPEAVKYAESLGKPAKADPANDEGEPA